jgi:hypothetical protein
MSTEDGPWQPRLWLSRLAHQTQNTVGHAACQHLTLMSLLKFLVVAVTTAISSFNQNMVGQGYMGRY